MRTFYFRQGISGLLMATMVAFISMLCVGFLTSCGGDGDDELKVGTQLLIALKSGSSDIDGMVYIFPDGDYDPTTFTMSTLGSIETKGGQKVTGFGSGAYYKGGGYCKYDCQPGEAFRLYDVYIDEDE